MNIRSTVITATLWLLAAGWTGNALAEPAAAGAHRRPSPEGAAVGFTNLEAGATVESPLTLKFFVNGMGIAPAGSDIPNTGHHHLLIDMAPPADLNLPLPMTERLMHFGQGQTEVTLQLAPGEHTLQLFFADYAHIPHEPAVMSQPITITVEPPLE